MDSSVNACKDSNLYHENTLLEKTHHVKQVTIPIVEAIALSDEESNALFPSCGDHHNHGYAVNAKMFSEIAQTPLTGGLYLLHTLCQQSAPLLEITEALNAFPLAATITTDDGWMPLHLICRNSDNLKSICLILEAYPEATSVTTPDGWYPLHQLCRYSHSLDAIKTVYLAFPQAALKKTSMGSNPLKLLLSYFPQEETERGGMNINHSSYKPVATAALCLSSLSLNNRNAMVKGAEGEPSIILEEGASVSVEGISVIASLVEHSAKRDKTTFDDVRNLLMNEISLEKLKNKKEKKDLIKLSKEKITVQ
jgi:hypothetical protein